MTEPAVPAMPTDAPDEVRVIETADVTEKLLDEVWSVVEGWYLDTPIDWDDVWTRVERYSTWSFGDEYDSPAMRKIQREMRDRKREV